MQIEHILQDEDSTLPAFFDHSRGPDAGLDFADVSFFEQKHTKPRLANAATD